MRERCTLKNIAIAAYIVLLTSSFAGCSKQSPPAAQNPGSAPAAAAPGGNPPAGPGESPAPAAQTAPAPAAENPVQQPAPAPAPAPAPPPKPKPRIAELAVDTPITVRTIQAITTKTAKAGDRFSATLEAPISSGGWAIAKRGATVRGRLVDATQGGRVKGKAGLTLQLTSFRAADGQTVPIVTSLSSAEAKGTKKKDAAKIGIGAGLGAAIGAIAGGGKGAAIGALVGGGAGTGLVLGTKGEAATIPSETVLTFRLLSPVQITEQLK